MRPDWASSKRTARRRRRNLRNCRRHLFEHGAGVIAAARRHQVVEQQRQVPSPQVGRETRKGEGLAALLGAHVGGHGEHSGDAEADLGFLLGREHLVQRRVGERFRLLAAPGGVQPDRGLSHQRPSQRMPSGSELEGALAQVGGRAGIGCAERLGGLEQRGDG
jgi:hypothetical protein